MRVRELQAEFDKMEDRARAESAQKADLQVSPTMLVGMAWLECKSRPNRSSPQPPG